ncbi:hypothetical protein H4219_003681 [Mycoemilia scoparia]|uniref:Uncharacterized protein n=1 Tax=Mycoemilia scoparia TaxID=417184 RepID=A0A9W7ZZT1_9FUNG|nr:hypothetical protein H4219_003681 [Mycoemilia scoparia]
MYQTLYSIIETIHANDDDDGDRDKLEYFLNRFEERNSRLEEICNESDKIFNDFAAVYDNEEEKKDVICYILDLKMSNSAMIAFFVLKEFCDIPDHKKNLRRLVLSMMKKCPIFKSLSFLQPTGKNKDEYTPDNTLDRVKESAVVYCERVNSTISFYKTKDQVDCIAACKLNEPIVDKYELIFKNLSILPDRPMEGTLIHNGEEAKANLVNRLCNSCSKNIVGLPVILKDGEELEPGFGVYLA